jgi:hypothetical protein
VDEYNAHIEEKFGWRETEPQFMPTLHPIKMDQPMDTNVCNTIYDTVAADHMVAGKVAHEKVAYHEDFLRACNDVPPFRDGKKKKPRCEVISPMHDEDWALFSERNPELLKDLSPRCVNTKLMCFTLEEEDFSEMGLQGRPLGGGNAGPADDLRFCYDRKDDPSWTDRIFYKSDASLAKVDTILYDTWTGQTPSDHFPVFGVFTIIPVQDRVTLRRRRLPERRTTPEPQDFKPTPNESDARRKAETGQLELEPS